MCSALAARYRAPAKVLTFSEEIQKSRFLTWVGPVENRDAARAWLDCIRQAHPQARHCCWGWICGAPQDSQGYACSDDGEPSGTAGRPILAALQGSGLGAIAAVVVRYYGGILLGTGGLVRAYSHGVSQLLLEMPVCERLAWRGFTLRYSYEETRLVEHCLQQHAVQVRHTDYQAEICIHAQCPEDLGDMLAESLWQQSRGRLRICWDNEA